MVMQGYQEGKVVSNTCCIIRHCAFFFFKCPSSMCKTNVLMWWQRCFPIFIGKFYSYRIKPNCHLFSQCCLSDCIPYGDIWDKVQVSLLFKSYVSLKYKVCPLPNKVPVTMRQATAVVILSHFSLFRSEGRVACFQAGGCQCMYFCCTFDTLNSNHSSQVVLREAGRGEVVFGDSWSTNAK